MTQLGEPYHGGEDEEQPLGERLRLAAARLFEANPDMVVPPATRFGGERLHFVVRTPAQQDAGLAPGESVEIPEMLSPFVVERSSVRGFAITQDDEVQIRDALTEEEATKLRASARRFSSVVYTGSAEEPTPFFERMWDRGSKAQRHLARELSMRSSNDRNILADRLSLLSAAEVYDPRTHGILHAPALPNGLRTGPDQIAPLADIQERQREVYRRSLPSVRRAMGHIFRGLVELPQRDVGTPGDHI